MRRFWLVLPLVLLLGACGSEQGFNENALQVPTGFIRVVHAMPDATSLSVNVQALSLGVVDYGSALPSQSILPAIDRTLSIEFNGIDGIQTLLSEIIRVEIGHSITVVITGSMAAPQIVVIDKAPVTSDAGTSADIQVIHVASDAPASVDFYLTTDEGPLTQPVTQLSRFQLSQPITRSAGTNNRLRITEAGSDAVLWDSGPFELAAESDLLFMLVDDFGPASAPGRVIVLDTNAVVSFPAEQLNSAVRFANMMAESDPVDFYFNAELVASGLEFQEVGDIRTQVAPGDATITVTASGDPETIIIEATVVPLGPASFYTISAVGQSASPLLSPSIDDFRRVSADALIAVSNFSDSLGGIAFFVPDPGQDHLEAPRFFVNPRITQAIRLPQGDYDLVVTDQVSSDARVGPLPVSLMGNGLYRVYVTDQKGGGLPAETVLGDDFDPTFDPFAITGSEAQ